ncbi:phosphoglycerate mutase family protein [Thalassotalea mangrovi]|nr:phosphoglycerate mutase family protein [Thalassotalea mangrovi]
MRNQSVAMPKSLLLIGIFLIAGLISVKANSQESSGSTGFSIYLIRHAEKQSTQQDPALTTCGIQRANQYAADFSAVELQAVYSSDYLRTRQTANPIASHQQLQLVVYDPRQLKDLATRLISEQRTALVVGHSNTTAVLAGMLANQELGEFSETEYDRIYRVDFKKGQRNITLTRQEFTCSL